MYRSFLFSLHLDASEAFYLTGYSFLASMLTMLNIWAEGRKDADVEAMRKQLHLPESLVEANRAYREIRDPEMEKYFSEYYKFASEPRHQHRICSFCG